MTIRRRRPYTAYRPDPAVPGNSELVPSELMYEVFDDVQRSKTLSIYMAVDGRQWTPAGRDGVLQVGHKAALVASRAWWRWLNKLPQQDPPK